ncbi:MAG: 3-oxoadipate enol-lactonase [Acidobacteria bacterium]|nr:3-oxoadipate enol-lactonase [Acidobacteriota bacterium]
MQCDGVRLFYRLEGNCEKPILVLSHSIGTDHGMWASQIPDLLPYFRVLRYDTRGHGASEVPRGEYSIEVLARDVLALVDALNIQHFAFCGLSLGGATGQWLSMHAGERVTALVLANTSPQFAPKSNWDARIQAVRDGGMKAVVNIAMERFFSQQRLAHGQADIDGTRAVFLGTDPLGYMGCCAALRDLDLRQSLGEIRVPTLIITGEWDISTPWQGHGEILARQIPRAQSAVLPAAHLSNVECPHAFSAAVLGFLLSQRTVDPLEAGFAIRRVVLGDAYVERAMRNTSDFDREFQELITRYAWGTIWTRPGLDRRTRRLLVLATMAALGRWEEFRMHAAAGLNHELETCDLKEVLLQTAVYAGVPVANTGFHIVKEVMDALENHKQRDQTSGPQS